MRTIFDVSNAVAAAPVACRGDGIQWHILLAKAGWTPFSISEHFVSRIHCATQLLSNSLRTGWLVVFPGDWRRIFQRSVAVECTKFGNLIYAIRIWRWIFKTHANSKHDQCIYSQRHARNHIYELKRHFLQFRFSNFYKFQRRGRTNK